jgi:hypothetical protein
MSSQHQPVAFDHPFRAGETLTGLKIGERYQHDDPHPLVRIRVDETTLVVSSDAIR